jgi:hypothetical protein
VITLPPTVFQTFTLKRPATPEFWRPATCEETACPRHRNGWRSVLDSSTRDGLRWIEWITRTSGRRYTQEEAGSVVTFTFERGQNCFEKHQLPRERDPIFLVRDGDQRGNPTGRRRVHAHGADWRDDMQENLSAVAEDRRKG